MNEAGTIGIDEVGRGAWAGPLLVVATVLRKGKKLPEGLTDSKALTKKKRLDLYEKIIEVCDIGEGWVSAEMIDKLGLSDSLKSATILAMMKLDAPKDNEVIIDGSVDFLANTQYNSVTTQVKADLDVPIVSASSIIAKVLRDELMQFHAKNWPEYGFDSNVGYGTKKHISALDTMGPCSLHRLSYKPVKQRLKT